MASEDLERGGPKVTGNDYPANITSSSSETSDRNWTSWLIPLFVVANVAVFALVMFVNNCPSENSSPHGSCVAAFLGRFSFQPLRENPLFGPSSSTLEKLGALELSKVVHAHQGWRLITCIWLHAGVVHLVSNMLSLVFIGIRLEQQFGFVRVGLIYMLSGFAGSILSAVFIHQNVSVGASGALFGLLGAMLSELLTNWSIYTSKAAALITLIIIIVVNLAVGMLPHVDNFAHIGGFLAGFLLGFVLLLRPQLSWVEKEHFSSDTRVKSNYKFYQYLFWVLALVLLISGYIVGLIMLFRGENGNNHCTWCHYFTCVPFSSWKCGN